MPRHSKKDRESPPNAPLSINQVVSYNLRAGREIRGLTQQDLAKRLEQLLKKRVTQATISSLERAWDGERRREFDVHELAGYAIALDLPMLWFFLPPPDDRRELETYPYQVQDLYLLALGRNDQLEPLYERLRQLGIRDPEPWEVTVEKIRRQPSASRRLSYRHRRTELLHALLAERADKLDGAADELGSLFDYLREVGIRGFIAEHTNDTSFSTLPKNSASQAEPVADDLGDLREEAPTTSPATT